VRKALLIAGALVLSFIALNTPAATADPTPDPNQFFACPVYYAGGGTGPLCDCRIHCGNGGYWSANGIPSDACSAAFAACCNGWGNATCN
jgi:hypothetical protein